MIHLLAVLAAVGLAAAREMPVDPATAARYASGEVHEAIMSRKHATWDSKRQAGAFRTEQYPEIKRHVPCVNGKARAIKGDANNTFRCKNMDLYHFLPHHKLGSSMGEGSSSWGWTSHDGREFIALGQADGAAFAEITPKGKLVYLGRLPQYSDPSIWREIRGYKHYMIIGSEAVGHNIQIFDMRKLLRVNPKKPVTFSNQKDLTGLYDQLPIGRTHNVVVNEETQFVYSVGAQPRNDSCASGLIFIDVADPSKPTNRGCAAQDGYVHDAQCLIYRGPHKKYQGREICYGYNENSLTIYDVHDKSAPRIISNTSYTGASYTHQGWVLDRNWQRYLLLDDEYDEYDKAGLAKDGHPITYIWDIGNLEHPKQTGYYRSESAHSVDHNQYVVGKYTFQSNYGSGVHVLDISSIPADPTGSKVEEVAFFDVFPDDDATPGGGVVDFVGTWSSYAFFKSGYIFVNTIERGGYVLKMLDREMPEDL